MATSSKRATRRSIVLGLMAGPVALGLSATPAKAGWLEDILGAVTGGGGSVSEADAAAGLKEALRVGTDRVVARLGRPDGYFLDSVVRIPLPGYLTRVQTALRAVGASHLLDDLELRLNRAAEAAAPHAKAIFVDAIRDLTISDALDILGGGDTAATDYFQRKMTPPLTSAFRPIISRELEGAGALTAFDRVADRYAQIPLVPALQADAKDRLITHGLDGALSGLFYYLGEEEAAIRRNPAKRTTEILRRVFK